MDYKVRGRDKISNMSTLILFPSACKKAILSTVPTPQQFAKSLSKFTVSEMWLQLIACVNSFY